MASELRWILAVICVPLLFAIWWWGSRRSRQAPGNPELRESAVTPDYENLDDSADVAHAVRGDAPASFGSARDWSVSPLEPLSIRTAHFETAEIDDLPMSAYPPGVDTPGVDTPGVATPGETALGPPTVSTTDYHDDPDRQVLEAVEAEEFETLEAFAPELPEPEPERLEPEPEPEPEPRRFEPEPEPKLRRPEPREPEPRARVTPEPPAARIDTDVTGSNRQAPNASETQRIVGLRVCAAGAVPWDGAALKFALENQGMAFGRYQVFHRRHGDGRSLFCAASLVEPGTFNLGTMARQTFVGLTLFAVLPGPAEPVQTFDALIRTAVGLAKELHGTVQDSSGVLLSPDRLEELREDVARFQALLNME